MLSWECLIYNIYYMAKQFGEIRNRKDIHRSFLKNGTDVPKEGQIGNINSLSNFESQTSGNFNSPAPNSPDNLQYKKNVNFLRSYFKDGTMHHFKNGLELANKTGNKKNVSNLSNLDEDPVIFGFDFIINHVTSPLFQSEAGQGGSTDMDDFFNTFESIPEIANRKSLYVDFIKQLELLFLTTRGGPFDTFKAHYLIGIGGVDNLINKSTGLGSEKQFAEFGKDKMTLTLREDNHLSGGYLTSLYNALSYSKINGKQIIPDNLLRFDATIVISEMRNYKKVKKALADADSPNGGLQEVSKVVSDNVSRYMYNVYDCQFFFDKHSHPAKVENDKKDITDSFDMSFFYKFSTMEMEKFKINDKESESDSEIYNAFQNIKYFNDGNRINPTRTYIGEQSENINAIRRNNFINAKYQESLKSYQEFDQVKSNNIEPDQSVTRESIDSLQALRQNSLKNSLEEQEQRRRDLREQNKENQQSTGLKKDQANTAIGYENISEDGRLTRQEKRGKEGALGGLIEKTKDFALNVVRLKRDRLINETVQNIRRSTGLRRISQPDNVYEYDPLSIGGFVRDQLQDFAGDSFTDLLGGIDDAV